jgi:hypothetical protein
MYLRAGGDHTHPIRFIQARTSHFGKNGTFNFCGLPANPIKLLPRCCHPLLAIAAELLLGFFHQSLDRLQL